MTNKPSYGLTAAKKVLGENVIKTDINTSDIYIYQEGCYLSGILGKNIINKKLKDALGDNYSIHNLKNAESYISHDTLQYIEYTQDFISLENGYLNVKHRRLKEHHKGVLLVNKFPVKYNPNIDYEDWDKFVLSSVDERRFADTLQEYVGYVFTNEQTAKKLLYTYGGTNSGKSTFYEILKIFFSFENCSDLNLGQLCKNFLTHNLRFMVANICADIDYKLRQSTVNILKNLTGGDTIAVDKKYAPDAIQMKNRAKILLSGNGAPNISEDAFNDDAFVGRWLPIPFPNKFSSDDTVKTRYSTPTAKSAILNWALDGLDRLESNGWEFSYNPNIEEIRDWFQEGIIPNQVELFTIQMCEPRPDYHIKKDVLYEAFEEWCGKNGYPILPPNDFGRKISNHRFWNLGNYRPLEDGVQVKCWRGLKLK